MGDKPHIYFTKPLHVTRLVRNLHELNPFTMPDLPAPHPNERLNKIRANMDLPAHENPYIGCYDAAYDALDEMLTELDRRQQVTADLLAGLVKLLTPPAAGELPDIAVARIHKAAARLGLTL